jgi:nucleoside-triphosphatase
MPQNYFIIGEPKTGKTTLLRELVDELRKNGLRVGGFISPDERHHGTRTAFQVMDVESGKKAQLANVKGDGPKVSKYHVDVRSFESIAVPSLRKAANYDVFVIDEIGVMELKSKRFSRMLDALLDSEIPIIATLHSNYVSRYGPLGETMNLDNANREAVHQRLLRKSVDSLTKEAPRAKKAKAPSKAVAAKARAAKKPRKAMAPKAKKARKKPGKARAGEKRPAMMERMEERPPAMMEERPAMKEEAEERREEKPRAMEEERKEKHEHKKKKGLLDRIKSLFGE